MTDLLVISHACFMAINRNVYLLFKESGWNLEIVAPSSLQFPAGRKAAEPARPEDPPLHFLELLGNNPRSYLFSGLDKLLSARQPRIILLDNDPVSRLALVVGKWAKANNAKLFCITCENLPLDLRSTLKRRGLKSLPATLAKRWLIRRTQPLVAGVFSINQEGKNIFQAEGFSQVAQMPLGFDPKYFFPDPAARVRIRQQHGLDKPVIAYFGRLTREKGIHILIRALQGLKSHPWYLMMDDFDEYASAYNQEVRTLMDKSRIRDRVIFIHPDHFEIAAYMNAADLVVVPSIASPAWKEQYGRVAAEALACGKTVIASDSGALPELLGGFGELFPEGNVAALRDLLERQLVRGDFDQPAQQGRVAAYARASLSIDRQKEIMENGFAPWQEKKLIG